MDLFVWLSKFSNKKIYIDGLVLVLISAMIDKEVTIIGPDDIWRSSPDEDEVILAYVGAHEYTFTEVGKILFSILILSNNRM